MDQNGRAARPDPNSKWIEMDASFRLAASEMDRNGREAAKTPGHRQGHETLASGRSARAPESPAQPAGCGPGTPPREYLAAPLYFAPK